MAAVAGGGGGGSGGAASSGKPRVLVLGGCGSIGRNLVKYLIDNKLVSSIRVADKKRPTMVFAGEEHRKALTSELVDFVQADLAMDEHVAATFDPTKGAFDVVFDLCAETAYGMKEDRYEKTVIAAEKCADAALKLGVKRFVFVSTGAVYKSTGKAAKESDATDPWTTPAKYLLAAEEKVNAAAKAGLPSLIVRPALVYGPADVQGLMPRAVCAATYRYTGEEMQLLWDKTLSTNTVHVFDLCRALWHLAAAGKTGAGSVYNVVDPGDTTQEKLAQVLAEVFKIKVGFHGLLVHGAARMAIGKVVDAANATHMTPWTRLLAENKIKATPLSPYLHPELLSNNHMKLDGSKLTSELKFTYKVPALTAPTLKDAVVRAVAQGLFPSTAKEESLGLGSKST